MFFEWLENWIKKVDRRLVFAFCSTFFSAIFTHVYRLTNQLLNHDDLWNFCDSRLALGVKFGRPFLGVFSRVTSPYGNLPWVNGIFAIIYLSFFVVIIVKMFDVRHKSIIAILGIVTAVFPTLTSQMAYIHCADYYTLTTLLAAIAVYVATKASSVFVKVVIGGLTLCLALGTYQSSISVAMGMIAIWILFEIINNTSGKQILKNMLWYLLMGITGCISYILCLFASIKVTGIELTEYMGISEVGQLEFKDILLSFAQAYKDFYYFFFVNSDRFTFYDFINLGIILFIIGMLICLFFVKRIYRDGINTILYFMFIIMFPCICHILLFASKSVSYHMLMQESLVLVYMLGLILVDKISMLLISIPSKLLLFTEGIVIAFFVFLCVNNFITTNIAYMDFQKSYDQTYAFAVRLASRIEPLDWYDYSSPTELYLVNYYIPNSEGSSLEGYMPEYTGVENTVFLDSEYHFISFLNNELGMNYVTIREEMIPWVEGTPEFQDMESWPSKESVKIIHGCTVLKMGDHEKNEDN